MLSLRLIRLFVCFSLLAVSSFSFAGHNTLNITIENKSHTPFSLIIYGNGPSYEIVNAFDSLASKETGTIQINYQAKNNDQKNPEPVYHILLLNSDKECCRVQYTAHPGRHSHDHFFKSEKLHAELKSFTGPCKAWKESDDVLHITLVEG